MFNLDTSSVHGNTLTGPYTPGSLLHNLTFLLLIVGMICIGGGIYGYFRNNKLIRDCPARAEGTVLGYDTMGVNLSGRSYSVDVPIISYSVNGVEYQAPAKNLRVNMSWRAYREGDKLPVCYNPANPQYSYAGNKTVMKLAGPFCVILGLSMIIFACIFQPR